MESISNEKMKDFMPTPESEEVLYENMIRAIYHGIGRTILEK